MRLLSFAIVFVILFCCMGCGADPLPDTTNPTTESQASSSTTLPSGTTEVPSDNSETYISRFLTDINFNGNISPNDELVAPGTLPDVSQIPKADQQLVGSDVLINLDSDQTPIAFLYYLDPSTGVERLAAVISCDNIPMLIVFQPELGGISGLCEALTTGEAFYATIVSITNISFEESMYAFSASENDGENAIDFNIPPENDGEKCWLVGFLGTQAGENYSGLFYANANSLEIYHRIFTRFSLDIEGT